MSTTKYKDNRIIIDESGFPVFIIDGVRYELFCEYPSRLDNGFIKVHVKEGGTDVVIDYGNGSACKGYYSTEQNKIKELFDYIEATISLNSGLDVYSEDLLKLLEAALKRGEKHPVLRDEIDGKNLFVSRVFNRFRQEKVLKELFAAPFVGEKMIYSVEYAKPERAVEQEYADDASELEELRPVEVAADNLPDGWKWVMHNDGSGHLESPNGNFYFSYDKNTSYAYGGGIEFQTDEKYNFDVFWGTFEEFKAHAEDEIAKEFCYLGKFNIPSIMNTLSDNAWYGREPTTVRLVAGENVITMDGYTYEPSYECFSATSSISLNGEILYGQDSRNVEAYRYEVYMTGKYKTLNEAVAHIKERLNVKDLALASEKSQVDNIISKATVKSEQSKDSDVNVKTVCDVDIDK